jgi:hypothetical protein
LGAGRSCDYVRVEDADAQKVYDGLMEMLSEQAVEHTLAPDACPECGEEYSGACGKCAVGHERG